MTRHYWTWPIACYIFLGGLGGGMLFLTFVLDMLTKAAILPTGLEATGLALVGVSAVEMFGIVVGLACLAVGTLLLIFELGQPILFERAFITKTSIIKWGAVLLTIALVAGIFWWTALTPWTWLHWTPWYGQLGFALVMEVITGISSFGIMVYTGILFSSMKSKPFWNTPALPILFVVSALSTGCAALSLCAGPLWTWLDTVTMADPRYILMVDPAQLAALTPEVLALLKEVTIHYLHMIDIVLVFAELLVIFLYLLLMVGAGNKVANTVAKRWLIGSWAPIFWIGMICAGLVIPQIMYLTGGFAAEYIAPVLILASGLLLRFMIVYSDDRRAVEGEELYQKRLPSHKDDFITKDWTKTPWYQAD